GRPDFIRLPSPAARTITCRGWVMRPFLGRRGHSSERAAASIDAMSSVASEPRPAASRIAGRWREWLVLGGGGALVAGALIDRTWEALPHPQRLAETVVLAVLAVLAALALRAWRGWPAASGLALVAIAGVAVFDGPLPLLAALLLALGATAAGRLAAGGVAALPVGLALVAAAGGWLLPLPVHARWTYVLVLGALAAWRWRELRAAGAG